jgi:PTH1 family peptidyl-tRNA hydrolase
MTYMNLSGRAVVQLLDWSGACPFEMLVICDDVNLPLGQIRLRPSGSDGGHNGLSSIIESLGTEEFARLRLGVGMPPDDVDMADFVLDEFRESEREVVSDMIGRATEAVRTLLRDGIEQAMTKHNRRTEHTGDGDV